MNMGRAFRDNDGRIGDGGEGIVGIGSGCRLSIRQAVDHGLRWKGAVDRLPCGFVEQLKFDTQGQDECCCAQAMSSMSICARS